MKDGQIIDHLFRHQYGKMVSILTRIFGLSNLEIIEDAVQDTFVNASLKWRTKLPENPEAWLTKAAKNRVVDLLRKIKADQNRITHFNNGPSSLLLNDLFLDHEIEDSQLRMIFIACHPTLNPKDQIGFALKTIAGFSTREISSALLLKEETIKKSLIRARKAIKENDLSFEFPEKQYIPQRIERVLEVLYLIFNEGFHSGKKEMLIRKELCGEAIRLCKMILKKEMFRTSSGYALFALMCFHSARLESKVNDQNEIVDLKNQDRSKWYQPLINLGNDAMIKSTSENKINTYHFEAAIAAEHLKAKSFEETNWEKILHLYQSLSELRKIPINQLNIAIVLIQLKNYPEAYIQLMEINPKKLEQRAYLYHASMAEYYKVTKDKKKAIEAIDKALELVKNEAEKNYLTKKKANIISGEPV